MEHSITEEFYQQAVNALHEIEGWTLEVDGKVKIFSKQHYKIGEHDYLANKMQTIVDLPLENLAAILTDVEKRPLWDSSKTEKVQVVDLREDESLIYVVGKSPSRLIMSPRDILTVRKLKSTTNDQQQRILQSIERSVKDERFPETSNYIRAFIHLQAIELVELGPQQTQLKTISIINLGGLIPEWFIRKMTQLGANQFTTQIETANKVLQQLKK